MAGWNDILYEIRDTPPQFDYVRRRYLKKLSQYTKRNTICYYSSWLSKRGANNLDINDSDMTGGYADERHMGRYQGIFCERLDAGREGAGNLMLHHVGSDQGILSGAD